MEDAGDASCLDGTMDRRDDTTTGQEYDETNELRPNRDVCIVA